MHSLDNTKYDLEICMIHKLSDDNTVGKLHETPNGVMLCRLFEEVHIMVQVISLSPNY